MKKDSIIKLAGSFGSAHLLVQGSEGLLSLSVEKFAD